MIASVVPDVDAAGIVLGLEAGAYETYHHLLAHNLLFGAGVTLVAGRAVGWRPLSLLLVFAAFLSHLVGDYFGSGPGWALWPLWPFSNLELMCECAWNLFSWQNSLIGVSAVALALWIAVARGRTPLELVKPTLDRTVVDALQLRVRAAACVVCATRATARCQACRRALCGTHSAGSATHPRCADCVGTVAV